LELASTDNTRYQGMSRQCVQLLGMLAGNSKKSHRDKTMNLQPRLGLPGTIFTSLLINHSRGFIFGYVGPDVPFAL
jgi:hypothetical protein